MLDRLRRVSGFALLLVPLMAAGQDPHPRGVDRFGDPLPDGAVSRLGTLRFREPGWVHAVAFSPHLRAIATASYEDSTVTLWKGETGEILREIELSGGNEVGSLAFSPDGKSLAVGGSGTILLNELEGETETERIHAGSEGARMGILGAVRHLAYSPDGKRIASSSFQGGIRIWDVESGQSVRRIDEDMVYTSSLAFSPDGKVLVAGCRGMTIRGWDIETGKEVLAIEVPEPPGDPRFGGSGSEPKVSLST